MKKSICMAALLSVSGICTLSQTVLADSADATCEFYKRGDEKHDKWGSCSFSQRQGYIDITLKDGNTYNLSPRSEANQFNDQEGRKVVRTQDGGNRQIYEWDNKRRKIVVTFYERMSGNESNAGAPVSSTDNVDVRAMARYCAGKASAKFQQRPTNISTQPAIQDQDMYSVFGQFPPSGADPTVFICTFTGDGKFVAVDKE